MPAAYPSAMPCEDIRDVVADNSLSCSAFASATDASPRALPPLSRGSCTFSAESPSAGSYEGGVESEWVSRRKSARAVTTSCAPCVSVLITVDGGSALLCCNVSFAVTFASLKGERKVILAPFAQKCARVLRAVIERLTGAASRWCS